VSTTAPEQAHVTLDSEQRRVLELTCRQGRSVFYTGPGGVGKSFVTSVILAFLRAVFSDTFSKAVAITAPTGIAATHIGGTTLHSAMGVGVPLVHEDFASRMGGGASGGKGKSLATQLQVLLIDEVSMLSAEFLDLLDEQVMAYRLTNDCILIAS
jgi:predicted ATPase with chaperone activity